MVSIAASSIPLSILFGELKSPKSNLVSYFRLRHKTLSATLLLYLTFDFLWLTLIPGEYMCRCATLTASVVQCTNERALSLRGEMPYAMKKTQTPRPSSAGPTQQCPKLPFLLRAVKLSSSGKWGRRDCGDPWEWVGTEVTSGL